MKYRFCLVGVPDGEKEPRPLWVPEHLAKTDQRLRIRGEDDNWDDSWVVVRFLDAQPIDIFEMQAKGGGG